MLLEEGRCVQSEGEDEVDGLEENAVLGVAAVGRLIGSAVLGAHQDLAQHVVEQLELSRLGDLVVLQESQALHLKPRTRNAVV